MKTKKLIRLIIPAFTILFFSCKRESLTSEPILQQSAISEKLKAWYEAKPGSLPSNSEKTISQSDRKISKPDWAQTRYYPAEQLYITPVAISGQTTSGKNILHKYLVARGAPDGPISSASYKYIITQKDAGPVSPLTANPTPAFLNAEQVPPEFKGAIFEYDMNNALVSGMYFEDGHMSNKSTKLNFKAAGVNTTPNFADPNECQGQVVCVEWFWQTWANGVLINEEYLYTTCECWGAGGGGGGGGQTPTAEEMLNQALMCGHPVSIKGPGSVISESSTSRSRFYPWTYYTITYNSGYGLGSFAYDYYSLETGTQIFGADNQWHWQSLTHTNYSRSGFSLGIIVFNLTNQNFDPHINTGSQGSNANMIITYDAEVSMFYQGVNVTRQSGLTSSATWSVSQYWGGIPGA